MPAKNNLLCSHYVLQFPTSPEAGGVIDYSMTQDRWAQQEVAVLQKQLDAMMRAGIQAQGGTAAAVAAQLVAWMNTQELGLAWAVNKYAGMVSREGWLLSGSGSGHTLVSRGGGLNLRCMVFGLYVPCQPVVNPAFVG